MLKLTYSSFSKKALNSYRTFLNLQFLKYNLKYVFIFLPKKRKLTTLLKSPHVNKKAKETFELFNYQFLLILNYDSKCFSFLKVNVPKALHLKWSFLK